MTTAARARLGSSSGPVTNVERSAPKSTNENSIAISPPAWPNSRKQSQRRWLRTVTARPAANAARNPSTPKVTPAAYAPRTSPMP